MNDMISGLGGGGVEFRTGRTNDGTLPGDDGPVSRATAGTHPYRKEK